MSRVRRVALPVGNFMVVNEAFDRITFRCRHCGNLGLISAVCVNLTRIVIEGFCAHCRYAEKKTIDILEVDRFLNAEPERECAEMLETAVPARKPVRTVDYPLSAQDAKAV